MKNKQDIKKIKFLKTNANMIIMAPVQEQQAMQKPWALRTTQGKMIDFKKLAVKNKHIIVKLQIICILVIWWAHFSLRSEFNYVVRAVFPSQSNQF